MDRNHTPAPEEAPSALDLEDYYFDGSNLVFTAVYHLKRGYCCGSDCRHCPYRGADDVALGASTGEPGTDCDSAV
jgi:hypothetical protein